MARPPQTATDLADLGLKDLIDLQQRVAVAIVERQQTERADLKSKIAALAAEAGLSLDEVLGLRRGRSGPKAPVAAKYRNPENPEETWSGRGRKPNWLVAKLQKRGTAIEDFRSEHAAAKHRDNIRTNNTASSL